MQGLFDKEVGGRVFASKSGGREASQKAGGRCSSSARSLARRLTVGAVAQAQRPLPGCIHYTLHA